MLCRSCGAPPRLGAGSLAHVNKAVWRLHCLRRGWLFITLPQLYWLTLAAQVWAKATENTSAHMHIISSVTAPKKCRRRVVYIEKST